MDRDWLAMEHYRLHTIERWPASAAREARLAAVRSSIESLVRTRPGGAPQFACVTCISDRQESKLVRFPERPVILALPKAA